MKSEDVEKLIDGIIEVDLNMDNNDDLQPKNPGLDQKNNHGIDDENNKELDHNQFESIDEDGLAREPAKLARMSNKMLQPQNPMLKHISGVNDVDNKDVGDDKNAGLKDKNKTIEHIISNIIKARKES